MGGPVGPLIEFGEGEPLRGGVVDERLQPGIQLGPLAQMRSDVHGCLSPSRWAGRSSGGDRNGAQWPAGCARRSAIAQITAR